MRSPSAFPRRRLGLLLQGWSTEYVHFRSAVEATVGMATGVPVPFPPLPSSRSAAAAKPLGGRDCMGLSGPSALTPHLPLSARERRCPTPVILCLGPGVESHDLSLPFQGYFGCSKSFPVPDRF